MKKYSKYIIPIFIFIIIILFYYYLSYKKEPFENKDSVIPKNVYLTWETKDLPSKMQESVKKLIQENPEFTYHFYDHDARRKYIANNFEQNVVKAYDALIPGAYKADLWRYCIMYKMGGIYLDIKLCTINGFKLIQLTDKEYFIRDIEESGSGVLNGLLVCKPGNQKMLNCVYQIVDNVKNKYYGRNSLAPTGPLLLVKQFTQKELNNFENIFLSENTYPYQKCIVKNNTPILIYYKGYIEDKIQLFESKNTKEYGELWANRKIYEESI